MPYWARASATRAVAVRRSRLLAIASRMRAWSCGSLMTSHQGTSAMDCAWASPSKKRCTGGGAGISGRL